MHEIIEAIHNVERIEYAGVHRVHGITPNQKVARPDFVEIQLDTLGLKQKPFEEKLIAELRRKGLRAEVHPRAAAPHDMLLVKQGSQWYHVFGYRDGSNTVKVAKESLRNIGPVEAVILSRRVHAIIRKDPKGLSR